MANDALIILRRPIEEIILNQDQYSMSVYERDQIRNIGELITALQEYAGMFPELASFLEGRIAGLAIEAQDVLEHFISRKNRFCFLARFRRGKKIRQAIDSIAGELMEINDKLQLSDSLVGNWSSSMAEMEEDELLFVDAPVASSSSVMVHLCYPPAAMRLQLEDSTAVKSSYVMEMEENGHKIDGGRRLSDSRATNSCETGEIGDVVGLDDDSLAIKTRLCGESPNLQVVPIVGMGGIGKTTLSRSVYNDPLTIQYFDVRAWITVSQDYSTERIVSSLVDSVKEFAIKKPGQSDEETVYKSLKGRRYLIVMDDMWSTNAWDDLRDLFPNDHNGSRIMLTTRLVDVATYAADSSPLHEMRFMSIRQSWELLRQRVFTDQDCSPEFEYIGWKIAKSCRGLPLAISVIAGLYPWLKEVQLRGGKLQTM